jgi:ADP-ribose pyrophosphatase
MRKTLPKRAVLVPPHAKRVFKGIIYDTYHWQQELYNGAKATFEMLKRPDTVKTIAIDGNKIIILEQEQPNHGLFYDIPGGIHDNNEEDELAAAKRELLEETGLTFKLWKLVNVVQPHNKIEQFVYTFIATGLIGKKDQKLDAGEKISVKYMSLKEAKEFLTPPKGRYLPKEIEKANSIDELLHLPEYS